MKQETAILEYNGDTAIFRLGGEVVTTVVAPVGCTDTFTELGGGFWHWTRKCIEPTDKMTMRLDNVGKPRYFLVPAVNYNGNGWGSGAQYSGFECDGTPWRFAWHRVSIPACTYAETDKWAVALFGDEAGGMSCAIYTEGENTVQELSWPEVEEPKTLSKRCWMPPFYGTMTPRRVFEGTLMILSAGDVKRRRVRDLLDFVWKSNYREVKMDYTPERVAELDMLGFRQMFLHRLNGLSGFQYNFDWLEEQGCFTKAPRNQCFEIGWCGQNAAVSCILLEEYLKTGNTDLRDKALAVLDSWSKHAFFPNGLMLVKLYAPPDNLDSVPNGTVPVDLDACNLGNGACGFLRAAQLCKQAGIDRPEYLQRGLGLCDFFVKIQQPTGEYARSFFIDGSINSLHGSIGAFIMLAVAEAYDMTGDIKYRNSALRGIDFYLSEFASAGVMTAGALDSNCIDKESGAPVLRGAMWAYELTGDKKYLEAAEDVAYYLATWQYHYSEKFPEGSLIAETNFDTYGSTSVSAAHNALDHYGIYWIPEYVKLAELTGNPMWRERARALWYSGIKLLSDGTLVIRNRVRPVGSQDESVRHTRWGRIDQRYFIPVEHCTIWQGVFRYETLRRLGGDWSLLR